MKHRLAAVLAVLAALTLGGCFDIEQVIELNEDLSGTARFKMGVSMEPMAYVMAAMKKGFAGEEGPPTAAEVEAARQEMLAQQEAQAETVDLEAEKKSMGEGLPDGIELLTADIQSEGLKMQVDLAFAFDKVSKLSEMQVGDDQDSPMHEPFAGLTVEDEGETLVIKSPPKNVVADAKEQAAASGAEEEEMDEQMREAFKDLRVAYRITTPFEVVEHNATRRDGRTLYWEYDLETFDKMTPEQAEEGVFVRYKKK